MRSKYIIMAKAVLTTSFLYFVLRNMEWVDIRNSFARMDGGLLLLGVAVLVLQPMIGTLRWKVITNALEGRVGVLESAALTYVGMFLNQALPASVGGDAVKVWLMHRRRHSLRLAFNSIALDRVIMLFGLLVLITFWTPTVSARLSELAALLPLFVVFIVAGAVIVCVADRLPGKLRSFRVFQIFAAIAADSRRVLLDPWVMLKLVPLVIASYVTMSVSIYAFVLALSEPLQFWTAMALVPSVLLVSVLPISIGGWGAREAAMVTVLGFVGVSAAGALGASVIFGFASILVTTPGLPLYLAHRREVARRAGETGAAARQDAYGELEA